MYKIQRHSSPKGNIINRTIRGRAPLGIEALNRIIAQDNINNAKALWQTVTSQCSLIPEKSGIGQTLKYTPGNN